MDTDNLDLNELWCGLKAGQPPITDLTLKMDNFKKDSRKKIIFTVAILAVTSICMISIWHCYQPRLATTKIGIILTIAAMMIFMFFSNQSLTLFKKTDGAESNRQYLKDFVAIKEKQQFIQTTVLNIYYLLLSIGIALYMYEYISRMTTFWAVSAYGTMGFWILFNWFYLRPKKIKNQQIKLNELVSKLQSINNQLEG
jgi:hypothetical protein